jgi:hypothetical protein
MHARGVPETPGRALRTYIEYILDTSPLDRERIILYGVTSQRQRGPEWACQRSQSPFRRGLPPRHMGYRDMVFIPGPDRLPLSTARRFPRLIFLVLDCGAPQPASGSLHLRCNWGLDAHSSRSGGLPREGIQRRVEEWANVAMFAMWLLKMEVICGEYSGSVNSMLVALVSQLVISSSQQFFEIFRLTPILNERSSSHKSSKNLLPPE